MMELTASRAFSLQCFWDSKLDTFMTNPPAPYLTCLPIATTKTPFFTIITTYFRLTFLSSKNCLSSVFDPSENALPQLQSHKLHSKLQCPLF